MNEVDQIKLIIRHSTIEQSRNSIYKRKWDTIEETRLAFALAVYDLIELRPIVKNSDDNDDIIKSVLLDSFCMSETDETFPIIVKLCKEVCADPDTHTERLSKLRKEKENKKTPKEDIKSVKQLTSEIDQELYKVLTEILMCGSLTSAMWKLTLNQPLSILETCIADGCIPYLHTHPKYEEMCAIAFAGIRAFILKVCRYCHNNIITSRRICCLTCKSVYYCSKQCKITDYKDQFGHLKNECKFLIKKI